MYSIDFELGAPNYVYVTFLTESVFVIYEIELIQQIFFH